MKRDTEADDETTASEVSEPEETTRRTATSAAPTIARGRARLSRDNSGSARASSSPEPSYSADKAGRRKKKDNAPENDDNASTASPTPSPEPSPRPSKSTNEKKRSKAGTGDDAKGSPSPTPSPEPSRASKSGKAGTGGNAKGSPSPTPSPEHSPRPSKAPPKSAPTKKATSIGDAERSGSASPTPSPSPPASPTPSSSPSPSPSPSPEPEEGDAPSRKKRKGKAGAARASSSPEPEAGVSSRHHLSKKCKLGGLKGTKKAMREDGGSPQAEGSGHGGKVEAVEEKIETPEERAARRRAELTRDLEAKAAKGPAKKKRKF